MGLDESIPGGLEIEVVGQGSIDQGVECLVFEGLTPYLLLRRRGDGGEALRDLHPHQVLYQRWSTAAGQSQEHGDQAEDPLSRSMCHFARQNQ